MAIMLGRLQMTVDDCIEAYVSLFDRVTSKQKHRATLEGIEQERFDSNEIEGAMKEIVERQGLKEDAFLKDSPDAKCRVSVYADHGRPETP